MSGGINLVPTLALASVDMFEFAFFPKLASGTLRSDNGSSETAL